MGYKKLLIGPVLALAVIFCLPAQYPGGAAPADEPLECLLPEDVLMETLLPAAQEDKLLVPEIPDTPVFAPFVSQLEGELRNNLVRLSWKDARDIRGPVYVYRSDTPFAALVSLPNPAEIPYGVCSYLEEVETPGLVYYLVAASDEYGRKYILPIQNINTVSIAVAQENVPGFTERFNQGARQATSSPNAPLPSIDTMNARTEEDRVIISFSGADREKNLLLYRSLSPITKLEDLLSALIIRQKASSPIIDYPLQGINYYYALVYEEDLAAGLFSIRIGRNATNAVQVGGAARTGSRNMPLPGLNLSAQSGAGTSPAPASMPSTWLPGFFTAGNGPLSDSIAFGIERRNENPSKKDIEVFPDDLGRNIGVSGSEEYQLRSIVQGYFAIKEWGKAAEEFRRFLELPRAANHRARAQFYLGQVYYFLGLPRDALFQFLSVQEQYPQACNSWIQAVLGDFAAK